MNEPFDSPDMSEFSPRLIHSDDGLWISPTSREVSYPKEGNRDCAELEESSFWFQHRNQCIVEAIRRFPPSGTLFDIGGGNGYVASGIQKAGFPVALVEPGAEGAGAAYRRGISPVICASMEDAGFTTGSLPAVGLFDVLEHIEDDVCFLKKIHSLLRPSGSLYLTVPALPMLWSKEDDYAGHFRRYTLSRLKETLRQAGFLINWDSYFFSPLPLPILLLRVIPSKFGLRRTGKLSTYKAEHSENSFAASLLRPLLRMELSALKKMRIPIGGSCLVAAHKIPSA